MRKITSKTEGQKKARRNQLAIGSVLIVVMVFSVLSYSLGSNSQNNSGTKIEYNGLEFVQENGFWNANIGDFKFSFLYNPREAINANSTLNPLSNYVNKPLYIYSENLESESEIARNLFYNVRLVERIQRACPAGETCEEDVPIKTCSDNFIIIKKSENTQIRQEEGCVFIEGDEAILSRLSDGFLFKILGIQ